MSNFFWNVFDAITDTFRHLSSANLQALAVVAIVIVVVGILLLRR
jgi:hypothetical protein